MAEIASEKQAEAQLVERAKTDEQAFRQLYELYFPKIYGYIKKRVGQTETAQDLVSETFLKAFSNLPTFVYKGAPFSAWLYRIATNLIIDYYRQEKHYQKVDIENYDLVAENQDIEKEILTSQQRMEIDKYLIKLPERERKVIELKFFAQLNNGEIAQTLNISANLVGVLIFRALKKMKNN